jgi:hypothetical protein
MKEEIKVEVEVEGVEDKSKKIKKVNRFAEKKEE